LSKIGRERTSKCGRYTIVRVEPHVVALLEWQGDDWVEIRRGFTRAVAYHHGLGPDEIQFVFQGVKNHAKQ
jgi:hypothetical protein